MCSASKACSMSQVHVRCIREVCFIQSRNKSNPLLVYERVYLPLCEVADTPIYIQGEDVIFNIIMYRPYLLESVFIAKEQYD